MSLRFKRYHGTPTAVFIEIEGCLLDHGCMVTVNAIQSLFKERGVDISDVEASLHPSRAALVGTDVTCKKTHLRHVLMDVCAEKWKAAKGSAPTEWDLESLFKDFSRIIVDEVKTVKPVSGAQEAMGAITAKGLKVGITAAFTGEAADAWLRHAHFHQFQVDACMSCAEVPNPNREGAFACVLPEPWRVMSLAANLGIFPLSTIIRVSTTKAGVEEGLNAGMWSVALSTTGLVEPFIHPGEKEPARVKRVKESFYRLGAHYVIDGIWELPRTIEDIETRMGRGETP
jgi:phosphonoacetaldehyde hydrolase